MLIPQMSLICKSGGESLLTDWARPLNSLMLFPLVIIPLHFTAKHFWAMLTFVFTCISIVTLLMLCQSIYTLKFGIALVAMVRLCLTQMYLSVVVLKVFLLVKSLRAFGTLYRHILFVGAVILTLVVVKSSLGKKLLIALIAWQGVMVSFVPLQ